MSLDHVSIGFVLEEPGEVGFGRDGWPRFLVKDDMSHDAD